MLSFITETCIVPIIMFALIGFVYDYIYYYWERQRIAVRESLHPTCRGLRFLYVIHYYPGVTNTL